VRGIVSRFGRLLRFLSNVAKLALEMMLEVSTKWPSISDFGELESQN
jgi:hypothetical protein